MPRLIIILCFLSVLTAFFVLDVHEYFNLAYLQGRSEMLREFVSSNYAQSMIVFALVYYVSIVFTIPIASVMTLLSGFLFGTVPAFFMVLITVTLAATTLFMIVQKYFHHVLCKRCEPIIRRFEEASGGSLLSVLLFLRLVPIFPFFLVNIAAGMTHMRARDFMLGTFVGVMPGTFVFVLSGMQLSTIEKVSDVFSLRVLGAFSLLGVLALIPTLFRWKKYRTMKKIGEQANENSH